MPLDADCVKGHLAIPLFLLSFFHFLEVDILAFVLRNNLTLCVLGIAFIVDFLISGGISIIIRATGRAIK